MSNTKTVMGQASNQYVTPLDITDVFSTYLWAGNDATQTINNGVDLTEGGLTWIKNRTLSNKPHFILDTERGGGKYLSSDTSYEERDTTGYANSFSFNSNGFSFTSASDYTNISGSDYASWTFRKAPKFFTCLTYTGTGSAQNISHDLGSVPGMIIVKRTDTTADWAVYHSGTGNTHHLSLNQTAAASQNSNVWNNTTPTSTHFSVNNFFRTGASGGTYVAYLFAHNDGDGGFGPNGDQDIIKCGSYTGNGSTDGPEIDLGFEPQWVMIKASSRTSRWWQWDNMRGLTVDSTAGTPYLRLNTSDAEAGTANYLNPQSTGFKIRTTLSELNESGQTYIYMAIRRGPLAQPESGTEVFDVGLRSGSGSDANTSSNILTDASIIMRRDSSTEYNLAGTRLQGLNNLFPESTSAEGAGAIDGWDTMAGLIVNGANGAVNTGSLVDYSWKRAPGFFDVVAYTGDGVANRTVSHNLGVAPEMMWVKERENARNWYVYHKDVGNTSTMYLDLTNAPDASATYWNNTTPSASEFTVGSSLGTNNNNYDLIAYLFASLPGISKVGSFTGNGTSQDIDCGFTSGARFVLLKRTDSSGTWFILDTARGTVAGNDAILRPNTTTAEDNNYDIIDPLSSGFTINYVSAYNMNASGAEYIFYAIA